MKISRKTKTLKIVLDLFDKRDNAYSVVELVSIFSKKMNKTTVYRILDRLEDSGLLHSFLDKDGLKRYAKESSIINTSQKILIILILYAMIAVFSAFLWKSTFLQSRILK